MDETLEDRLAAVERALTDTDCDLAALASEGEIADRVQTMESEMDDIAERVAELEAATQAIRGYVGNVRAVNEEVRERADLALETAERANGGPDSPESTISRERETHLDDDLSSDEWTTSPHAEEPTLELAADRRTASEDDHTQSNGDQCPLCDDVPGRSDQNTRQESESRQFSSHTPDRLQGLTDGGLVQEDETSTTSDNPGLFPRIRSLL